jgi:hypothetical protein
MKWIVLGIGILLQPYNIFRQINLPTIVKAVKITVIRFHLLAINQLLKLDSLNGNYDLDVLILEQRSEILCVDFGRRHNQNEWLSECLEPGKDILDIRKRRIADDDLPAIRFVKIYVFVDDFRF